MEEYWGYKMNWKEFFKPNLLKIILIIILSAVVLYYIYYSVYSTSFYVGVCASDGPCLDFKELAINKVITLAIPIISLVYLSSCLIDYIIKKLKK